MVLGCFLDVKNKSFQEGRFMEGELKGTKRNLSVLGWIELHWGVLHSIFSALKKNDIGSLHLSNH